MATDDLGGRQTSEPVGITVGDLPTGVLYVLLDPAAVNASDQAIIDGLRGYGFDVEVVLYGYDTGAALIDGTPAPARRAHLLLADTTFENLNDDGAALVEAAIAWALDAAVEPADIPLSIERVGADLKLAWPTGGPAAALYSAMDLVNPTWAQVPEPVVPEGNANTATVTPVLNEEHFSLRTP